MTTPLSMQCQNDTVPTTIVRRRSSANSFSSGASFSSTSSSFDTNSIPSNTSQKSFGVISIPSIKAFIKRKINNTENNDDDTNNNNNTNDNNYIYEENDESLCLKESPKNVHKPHSILDIEHDLVGNTSKQNVFLFSNEDEFTNKIKSNDDVDDDDDDDDDDENLLLINNDLEHQNCVSDITDESDRLKSLEYYPAPMLWKWIKKRSCNEDRGSQDYSNKYFNKTFPKKYRRVLHVVYLTLLAFVYALLYKVNNDSASVEGYGEPFIVDCYKSFEDVDANNMTFKNDQVDNLHIDHNIDMINISTTEWKPVRCGFMCSFLGKKGTMNMLLSEDGAPFFSKDTAFCKAAAEIHAVGSMHGGCTLVRKVKSSKINFNFENSDDKNNNDNIARYTETKQEYIYQFKSEGLQCHRCSYHNLVIFFITILFLSIFVCFGPDKIVLFFVTISLLYWYLVFNSQPHYTNYWTQHTLAQFFPYLFCCYFIYAMIVEYTLFDVSNINYSFDTIMLYIIPIFLALHMNFVKPILDFSISFGNSGFSSFNPAQWIMVILIFIILVALIGYHLRLIYQHKLIIRYAVGYTCLAFAIGTTTGIIMLFSNTLNFHFHHYTLALLLLPFTRFRDRVSMVCQGILIGMFINGIAGYGFDSLYMIKGV